MNLVLARAVGAVTLFAAVSASIGAPPAPVHDVFTFGAKGDGKTNDREALQRAIDVCKGTGGSVYLHSGKFLSGQITLGSDMTLFIEPSATLVGIQSTNYWEYPPKAAATTNQNNLSCQKRLIWGEHLKNVTITGGGTIDGNGDYAPWVSRKGKIHESLRPSILEFARSENIQVSDLRIRRPGMWTQVYLECSGVVLRKLDIDTENIPANKDGMDICDCHGVLIEDCKIKAQDDGICFKSGSAFGCRDIVVRRCAIDKMGISAGNCVKFGTASYGAFSNVLCENLVLRNTGNTAITWESVDGSAINKVEVRDCVVSNAAQVISVIVGRRYRTDVSLNQPVGSASNVVFRNITSSGGTRPIACLISGDAESPVRDVLLSNLKLRFPGGVDAIPPEPVEYKHDYPEGTHFGDLPAYAFYVRHADGVRFENCEFTLDHRDARPWLATKDATNIVAEGVSAK